MRAHVEQLKRMLKTVALAGQTQVAVQRLRVLRDSRSRVVFLGDSRAKAWPPPAARTAFTYINRGIGFDTTEHVWRRIASHVTPLQPSVVVVQVGVNDFREVLLAPENAVAIRERCHAAIVRIVERLQANGAHVVLSTIFPVGRVDAEHAPDFWTIRVAHAADQVMLAVNAVNASIHSLQGPQLTLLDACALLCDEKGFLKTHYTRDGLHCNAAAYAALNAVLVPILDATQNKHLPVCRSFPTGANR